MVSNAIDSLINRRLERGCDSAAWHRYRREKMEQLPRGRRSFTMPERTDWETWRKKLLDPRAFNVELKMDGTVTYETVWSHRGPVVIPGAAKLRSIGRCVGWSYGGLEGWLERVRLPYLSLADQSHPPARCVVLDDPPQDG